MNKNKIIFAIVISGLLGTAAHTRAFARPNTPARAQDCLTHRIAMDGQRPSSPIQSFTSGPGILGWFMLANANTLKYSISDRDVCVNNRFIITQLHPSKPNKPGLSYPQSCNYDTLVRYAQRCGLTIVQGGNHAIVKRADGTTVTVIPRSLKANNTCRSIINALVNECGR
jgi:hypothetical protein